MTLGERLRTISAEKSLLAGLLLLGAALRLRQYFSGRSLWLDEAMLALNIVGRSFAGLLQPLDYDQGAPLGFLLLEKLATALLGNNEFSLRLVPLLAGCAALVLFALLLRRVTGKIGRFTALALFALGAPLVYYASEVKQYSLDVFVAVLLLWLAGEGIHAGHEVDGEEIRNEKREGQERRNKKREMREERGNKKQETREEQGTREERGTRRGWVYGLGVAGVLGVWFSHPAVFVLAGVGATLLLDAALRKDFARLKRMLAIVGVWAASFILLYFANLRGLEGNAFLTGYWGDAFMPLPPWANLNWFPQTLQGVLDMPVGLGSVWGLAALLMAAGLAGLLRRRWQFGALLALTLLAALAASALGKYPFSGRILLFAAPVFLVLAGAGVQTVAGWVPYPRPLSAAIALALAALLLYQPALSAAQNFAAPKYYEHIRPTMVYLQANRKPGDVIYVYSWAVPAFRYYAPLYGISDFIAGDKHENDPQGLTGELDALQGNKRVWVLFSHVYEKGDFNEKDFILARLDEIGEKKRTFREAGTSVDLVLYDLGE